MKILNVRTIRGPNVFHYRPVITMILQLDEYADTASTDIAGLRERLVELLPGLQKHFCSPGYEGGFIERLEKGTYFAHIIEHVALELSELAEIGVAYGKSIYDGEQGRYKVIVRYKCDKGMTFLLKSAVELTRNLAQSLPYNVEECIAEAKRIVQKYEVGPSTQAIITAAEKRNIPWERMDDHNLIQLGWGKYRKFIQATTTSSTSNISVDIAQDKFLTKKLLERALVRVPSGKTIYSVEEGIDFLKTAQTAVAIKPLDGNQGRGITLNIKFEGEIAMAFAMASEHSSHVLIEEYLKGNDYRLVFVDNKLIAAAHRIPCHVKGDGKSSLQELINKENLNPLRGDSHEKPLTKIFINKESLRVLLSQELTLDSVPEKGKTVFLKETANLSTGGCAVDVTDEVHPDIKSMCERAARVTGLDICGIDFIAEDIAKPLAGQSAGLIEVNAGPGLRMHQYPSFGRPRDVGGAIVDSMFKDNNGRIPVVAITGTNGKTTCSRLLNHIFTVAGKIVGNTTSDGIYIGNQLIEEGDTTGPISANAVLSDPAVEIAILETARGGIVKRGLAFDYCDVSIFTTVNSDHIGQDGIKCIDDIIKIKSLLIEQVKNGGTVILNADCRDISDLTFNEKFDWKNKKIIFISLKENNAKVVSHVRDGGHAYFLRSGKIIEALGEHESIVADIHDIPLTMNGTAEFHVWNSMAAIAAAHALKVSDETIIKSLATFNQLNNPGRTNLYKAKNGYLLMDFGHNPESFTAVSAMARKWNVSSITGVVAAPGDRSDEMIRLSGLYAAYCFDKIILREDEDKRGRQTGEVSNILFKMIKSERPSLDCKIVINSRMALQTALDEMKDDELVIFFYDFLKETDDILKESRISSVIAPAFFKNKKTPVQMPIRDKTWLEYSY